MKRLARLFLLSTFILLSAIASAQTTSTQSAKGVLWEIKSATNTAYLFGSIHLAKADFYPLPSTVEQAYQQADTLVVEADPTDFAATQKAMALLTYAAPDTLQKHLRAQTWREIQSVTGVAAEQFQTLRPAVLVVAFAMQVYGRQGYDPRYGIDLHFIHRAKADQKKLVELESMEFQARVLGGLSDEDGDEMVGETLREMRNGGLQREAEAMIDTWKSGNAEALAEVLRAASNKDAGSRKIMKLLLDDRNIGMAQKITRMLDDGTKAFIVVGAGHVAGVNSITDILRKQGLQVRQIK